MGQWLFVMLHTGTRDAYCECRTKVLRTLMAIDLFDGGNSLKALHTRPFVHIVVSMACTF